MIFLCGNCQAKYQLPDERVAGRTVRMKCRKCGHLIEAKGPPLEASAEQDAAKEAQEPAPSAPPAGWYVGIGGTPTGPLGEEEIASKLDEGVVTSDSLVWREGLEGWKPLSAIDELKSLVAAKPEPEPEAELEPEPESLPPVPSAPPSPPRVVPIVQAAPRPSIAGIPRPPPARPPAPRTSLTPTVSSRLAAAPKLEEEPSFAREAAPPPEPTPVLAAVPAPEPTPASRPEPLAPLAVEPAKFENESSSLQNAGIAAAPSVERAESLVIPIAAPRRRVHPAAWVVVGLGGVLIGVFAGLSLAEKPKPEVQIVTVSVPVEAPPPPAATAEAPSEPDEAEAAAEAPAEPSKTPKVAAAATNEARPRAATTATGSKSSGQAAPAMTGLSSLSGLGTGPTPGPGKSGSAGGGGALTQAEVERVVQSHRAFVKRRCWELALATKSQGAPSSARVMTTITIAPDGRVTNASATGGEGYPGLSSCVAGQVRGWKFPPSEGGTVNVPFVFAAQ